MPIDESKVEWDSPTPSAIDEAKVEWDSPVSPVGLVQTPAAGSNPPAAGQSAPNYFVRTLKNVPGDVANIVSGTASAIAHPYDTARGVGRLVGGEISKAAATIAGKDSKAEAEKYGNQTEDEAASSFNESASNAVAHPLDTFEHAPVSTALTVAAPLRSALKASTAAAGKVGSVAGNVAAETLGKSTGVGARPIREAYQAGRASPLSGAREAFEAARTGGSGATAVEQASNAFKQLKARRDSVYEASKPDWADVAVPHGRLKDVGDAYRRTLDTLKDPATGQWKVAPKELASVQEVGDILDDWGSSLSPNAPLKAGTLDNLKQRLNAIYPEKEHTQAGRVISAVNEKIQDVIKTSDPHGSYANAMREYEASTKELREIEKSLGLGRKVGTDTTSKKLRANLKEPSETSGTYAPIDTLATTEAGQNLAPTIAGESLRPWLPRGIVGAGAPYATIAGAILSPKALVAAPFFSPRAVGAMARRTGDAARLANEATQPISAADKAIASALAHGGTKAARAAAALSILRRQQEKQEQENEQ